MKGSEANPAGYVLIGKAGLSRPLGIKPVRSRSLNISLVPYYLKRRTRPITSDVAPSRTYNYMGNTKGISISY